MNMQRICSHEYHFGLESQNTYISTRMLTYTRNTLLWAENGFRVNCEVYEKWSQEGRNVFGSFFQKNE